MRNTSLYTYMHGTMCWRVGVGYSTWSINACFVLAHICKEQNIAGTQVEIFLFLRTKVRVAMTMSHRVLAPCKTNEVVVTGLPLRLPLRLFVLQKHFRHSAGLKPLVVHTYAHACCFTAGI